MNSSMQLVAAGVTGESGSSTIGLSAMKRRITLASSPGWLKLIACAAPSMTTIRTWFSSCPAISLTRPGLGIRGSRLPRTASVGIGTSSSRSRAGNWVSARKSNIVLGTPKRR